MMIVGALLGALGLICILLRRTLLGVLIGIQLLVIGATTFFVLASITSESASVASQGHVFSVFIALGGVAQLVVGYALAVRLFYLKKRTGMDELRSLKN